jgi:hypothetical protein
MSLRSDSMPKEYNNNKPKGGNRPPNRNSQQPTLPSVYMTVPVTPYTCAHPGGSQGAWTDARFVYQARKTLNLASANGLAARQAIIQTALDQMADTSKIKDWDMTATTGERAQSTNLLLNVWHLMWNLFTQMGFRKVHARYVQTSGSDSSAGLPLTVDGWNTIIAELEQSNVPVPDFLLSWIIDACPIWLLYNEFPLRSFPPAFYLPWLSQLTLADFRTLRNTIAGQIIGVEHWQKIGLPFHYFNRSMIAKIKMIIGRRPSSDENLYWLAQEGFEYRDSAGATTYGYAGGDFVTNMTTAYSNRAYYWLMQPWHLHSLQQWFERYDVTNNPTGCLEYATLSVNSKWGLYNYDIIGSARTELADSAANTILMFEMHPPAFSTKAQVAPTNMTAGDGSYTVLMGTNVWALSYSYAMISNRAASYLTAYIVNGGIKDGLPTSGISMQADLGRSGVDGSYSTSGSSGGQSNVSRPFSENGQPSKRTRPAKRPKK